jgi:hypothetical protein
MAHESDDEELRPGLVRVVDEDEPVATVTRARPANGNGEDKDELRAQVARLEGEVASLRIAAGLEGRREEVATVGDVLDANAAQAAALRAELAEDLRQRYDELCGAIAERVEARLLDAVAPEDEENGKPHRGKAKKAAGKTNGPRSLRELEGPFVRDNERGVWFRDQEGNWYDEDGEPA